MTRVWSSEAVSRYGRYAPSVGHRPCTKSVTCFAAKSVTF